MADGRRELGWWTFEKSGGGFVDPNWTIGQHRHLLHPFACAFGRGLLSHDCMKSSVFLTWFILQEAGLLTGVQIAMLPSPAEKMAVGQNPFCTLAHTPG